MQRVLCHRPRAALLASLSLVAATIFLIGAAASAAAKSTICQNEEGDPCFLEISAPESVPVGQPFMVKVILFEHGFENPDFPLPKSDFCASKTMVSLELSQDEGPVTTYVSKASAGVATFNVSVPAGGSWFLDAFVFHGEGSPNCGFFDGGSAELTAVDVPPGQPIAPCPADVTCVQVTNNGAGGGSAATLFASDGTFPSAFFEPYDGNGCATPPTDPNNGVLDFTFIGDSQKTIVIELSPSLVTKGIGQFQVCWESTHPFTVLGGGQAVPNGAGLFVGYLPNCGPNGTVPCVLYKAATPRNGALFRILAPPGDADPKAYP